MGCFESRPQDSSKRISHMSSWYYPVMALATLPSMSQPYPARITLIRWTCPTKNCSFIPVHMEQLKESIWSGLAHWWFSFTTINPFFRSFPSFPVSFSFSLGFLLLFPLFLYVQSRFPRRLGKQGGLWECLLRVSYPHWCDGWLLGRYVLAQLGPLPATSFAKCCSLEYEAHTERFRKALGSLLGAVKRSA